MISVPKKQTPIVRPLPHLADRPLRFANLWRTVALLADQAEEVKAKYPNAITAENYQRDFENALLGLIAVHREFWNTSTLRESAEALEDAKAAEAEWLVRNHLKTVQSAEA